MIRKHSLIELVIIPIAYCLPIVNLYKELMVNNICRREYFLSFEDCKNNVSINSEVQKQIALYTSHERIISIIFGTPVPLLLSAAFITFKSISLICIQLGALVTMAMALLLYNSFSFSPNLLAYIVGILSSIFNFNGLFNLIFLYICINYPKNKRILRLSTMAVALCFSNIVSQTSLGPSIVHLGFSYTIVIYICAMLLATFFLMTLEDLDPHKEQTDEGEYSEFRKSLSYTTYVLNFFHFLKAISSKNKRKFLSLLTGNILLHCVRDCMGALMVFYLLSANIRADIKTINYFISGNSLLVSLALLMILPLIQRVFKVKDWITTVIGEIISTSFIIAFAFVTSKTQAFAILPLSMFEAFSGILTSNRMSRILETSHLFIFSGIQGSIAFPIGSLFTIGMLSVYSLTERTFPGIVLLIVAAIRLFSTFFLVFFMKSTSDGDILKVTNLGDEGDHEPMLEELNLTETPTSATE